MVLLELGDAVPVQCHRPPLGASVGQCAAGRSSWPTRSHTVARSAPIPLPSTCAMRGSTSSAAYDSPTRPENVWRGPRTATPGRRRPADRRSARPPSGAARTASPISTPTPGHLVPAGDAKPVAIANEPEPEHEEQHRQDRVDDRIQPFVRRVVAPPANRGAGRVVRRRARGLRWHRRTKEARDATILVGTDTSAAADLAVEDAAGLARDRGAELLVLYVQPEATCAPWWTRDAPPIPTRTSRGSTRFPGVATRTRVERGEPRRTDLRGRGRGGAPTRS